MKILFRPSEETREELTVAEKYCGVVTSRMNLKNEIVIGRYSVLPFYQELEKDLQSQGSYLINSCRAHQHIANFDYYEHVRQYTPKSWFSLEDMRSSGYAGPFVLKGRTNSRKQLWRTHMYAPTADDAVRIGCDLMQDPLIGDQGLVIREFEHFKVLDVGVNGMPMVNEWRFFYYRQQRLTHGFYWTTTDNVGTMDDRGLAYADMLAVILSRHVTFFVLDIAQQLNGQWRLIEVNDGQMSGLSDCDPHELYRNLAKI